jgi:two-component system response regulator NreC
MQDNALMTHKISVLIADDHAVLRAGLKMLLEAEDDMEVLGEAADGVDAIEKAAAHQPDIILLDITMPRMNGLSVVGHLKNRAPHTAVLILTMHDDEGYLREALAEGVAGYVLKQAADTELLSAIRAVYQGGTYLHRSHAHILLENPAEPVRRSTEESDQYERLSQREREVLHYLALGFTNKQAADKLYLSVKTVETYKSRLMSKLGLHNRAELVRFAMQSGMKIENE